MTDAKSTTTRPMAMVPLSDLNDLDAVVHALGIEDSNTTPAEAVAELYVEIERLRAERDDLLEQVRKQIGL